MNIIVFTRYTCTSDYTLKHHTKVGALQPTLRCLLRVTKLRMSAAAVQVPIGVEDQLEGVVDLVRWKALYNKGTKG